MTDTNRRQRLRFRSWHRGIKEMDLLMGSFADANLETFTSEQLDQYEALLEVSDPDLYNWITGIEGVPLEHNSEVMGLLSKHRFAKKLG